jgi:hypothetical protein
MTNFIEVQGSPMSAAISRWENEGGATIWPGNPQTDSIKTARPTIIAALLLASVAAFAIHYAYS